MNRTIDITYFENGQQSTVQENPVESYDVDTKYFEEYFGLTRDTREDLIDHHFSGYGYIEDPEEDKKTINIWRAAAAFASLSILIGGMATLFLFTLSCIAFHRIYLILLSGAFFMCFFFNMLTLIVFSSGACKADYCDSDNPDYPTRSPVDEQLLSGVPQDDECRDGCSVGVGAGASIGAGILWLICGVVVAFVLKVDKENTNVKEQSHEMTPLTNTPQSLSEPLFANGTNVQINGLKSSANFNGRHATIIQYLATEGRYMVELADTKEMINLKPGNLVEARGGKGRNTRRRRHRDVEPDDDQVCYSDDIQPQVTDSRSGHADDGISSIPPPSHEEAGGAYQEVLVD